MKKNSAELLIGAHTSAAGGVFNALYHGREIGATTIQLFTANQRRWLSKPLESEVISKWKSVLDETGLKEIMSHDSYLINLGAPEESENLVKSREAFREEIKRCNDLHITYLNFHPGAALLESKEKCLDQIIKSLLLMEHHLAEGSTRLLLEATAGQGTAVGNRFEDLGYIISRVEQRIPIGVCIDTCHIFVAGYDIRTPEAWDHTLKEFDHIVGLKHLYAFHINDSKTGLGSRVDRHAHLGEGLIGIESFRHLMKDPRTREIPKYLETPKDEMWAKEISLLREFGEV